MATATVIINVDLARPGTLPRVYAVQGEKGSRIIRFRLYENGAEWIEATNAAATVHFRRADGTGGSFDGQAVSGNDVYVTLSEAVCAKAGPVNLVVELSENATMIATWPIVVQVAANPGCQKLAEDNTSEESSPAGSATAPYIIDLYEAAKIIRDSKDARTLDVTDAVDVEALLAAQEAGQEIRFRFGIYGDDGEIVVRVDEYRYSVGGHRFSSLGVMNTFGYSAYILLATQVGEGWSVALLYWADPMATLVKTVNGMEPDENGNVDIPAPTSVDMTNYESGKIRLTYANDEAMDVSVEFDASGNPIKFSNGTEEFTITWPEEVATDE